MDQEAGNNPETIITEYILGLNLQRLHNTDIKFVQQAEKIRCFVSDNIYQRFIILQSIYYDNEKLKLIDKSCLGSTNFCTSHEQKISILSGMKNGLELSFDKCNSSCFVEAWNQWLELFPCFSENTFCKNMWPFVHGIVHCSKNIPQVLSPNEISSMDTNTEFTNTLSLDKLLVNWNKVIDISIY